jgi:hypothetical protein
MFRLRHSHSLVLQPADAGTSHSHHLYFRFCVGCVEKTATHSHPHITEDSDAIYKSHPGISPGLQAKYIRISNLSLARLRFLTVIVCVVLSIDFDVY